MRGTYSIDPRERNERVLRHRVQSVGRSVPLSTGRIALSLSEVSRKTRSRLQDRVRYIGLIKIVDIPFFPHVEQEERIHVRVEQRRTRGDVDVKRAIGGAM